MSLLRIQPRDCSPLGQEVLWYMQEHNVSMNALAKQAGMSQPNLRSICLGDTSPTTKTLRKLARAMQRHPLQLYLMLYEEASTPEELDELVQVLETTIQSLKSQLAAKTAPFMATPIELTSRPSA